MGIILPIKNKAVLPVIGGLLASALVIGWWFGIRDSTPGVQERRASFPAYGSVEELSEAANVIVLGTVRGIAGHDLDRGIKSDRVLGIFNYGVTATPIVFYQFEVSSALKGQPRTNEIIVVRSDPKRVRNHSETELKNGESLLLFLADRTTDPFDTRRFEKFPYLYVPLSLDSGVFDVSGGFATPRLKGLFSGPDGPGASSFTIEEIRSSIGEDVRTEVPEEMPVSGR